MKRIALLLVGTIMLLHSEAPAVANANVTLGDEGPMPELRGAVAWLNSAPLTPQSLRGKVVLVNFWTYSCINSLRVAPYKKLGARKAPCGTERLKSSSSIPESKSFRSHLDERCMIW
jgi:hypothetical protein